MIQDRAIALFCNHAFCYECIQGLRTTECPQCHLLGRVEIVVRIRHQVKTVGQPSQMVTVEDLTTPQMDPGFDGNFDEGSLLAMVYWTPVDTSLYVLYPVQIGQSGRYRLGIRKLQSEESLISTTTPSMIFVLPDALAQVTAHLQARGVTIVDEDAQEWPLRH